MKKVDLSKIKWVDIGCGRRPRAGYTSVDKFVKADIQGDILDLPFPDESVEKINCSHVLEHLPIKDGPKALAECFRVLKVGGEMEIEVPDLEKVMQTFLNLPEDKKWGWHIQSIFGLQDNEGEFHKNGFTIARLLELLKGTGFNIISQAQYFSYPFTQFVIYVKATKNV